MQTDRFNCRLSSCLMSNAKRAKEMSVEKDHGAKTSLKTEEIEKRNRTSIGESSPRSSHSHDEYPTVQPISGLSGTLTRTKSAASQANSGQSIQSNPV